MDEILHLRRKSTQKRRRELAAYVTEDAQQNERLNQERLSQQLALNQDARSITRISPVAMVQNLFEAFAGNGFERLYAILENVRSLPANRDCIEKTGMMQIASTRGRARRHVSEKGSDGSNTEVQGRTQLNRDFNTAAMDMLMLTLFFIVLMSGGISRLRPRGDLSHVHNTYPPRTA